MIDYTNHTTREKKVKPNGLTFLVHGIGVELEEKLDAGFEQGVIFERGVGGKELFGGGLRLVQER